MNRKTKHFGKNRNLSTESQTIGHIRTLIDEILRDGPPPRVHFAWEGDLPVEASSPFAAHRLSVCLSKTARYTLMRQGRRTEVELKRGEILYALPRCLMETHPQSRHLSFGLVFQSDLTRFLLAKKSPQRGPAFTHRFLMVHHSHATLDAEGRALLTALDARAQEPDDPRVLQRLVELLLLKAQTLLAPGMKAADGKGRLTWLAACQFIQEHLQYPLGRKDLARFLRVHPNHISRLFTQFGSGTFHAYLLHARMTRARRLMANPALSIADVAATCGFTDAGYFARCYRKFYGLSATREQSARLKMEIESKKSI